MSLQFAAPLQEQVPFAHANVADAGELIAAHANISNEGKISRENICRPRQTTNQTNPRQLETASALIAKGSE
jgi:hypothetical protein